MHSSMRLTLRLHVLQERLDAGGGLYADELGYWLAVPKRDDGRQGRDLVPPGELLLVVRVHRDH